ncbi:hypothetical protein FRC03_008722 [Tulasnella sp. 419]|nr:hypothetical protein FRC03_008722 [Tulasnella sp. 419]
MEKPSIFIIPPEIISDFLVYAHSTNDVIPQEVSITTTDSHQKYNAHRRSIATLSSVCRLFHNATLKTPQLWTQINIPQKLTPCLISHIQKQVTRSGSLPLFIQYDITNDSIDFFLRVLVPQFPRCRAIHLDIGKLSPGFAVSRLVEQGLSHSFPKLHALTISGTQMLSMYGGLGIFPAFNAPVLSTARIEGFLPQFLGQPPPLTSLTISPLLCPLEDFIQYLDLFKDTLRVLDIESNHLSEGEDMFVEDVTHCMERLEECKLKMSFYSSFLVLSQIRAPLLKRLEVDLIGDPGEPVAIGWTPWNLHSPSELIWTISHENSVHHLGMFLRYTSSITKLEIIVPRQAADVTNRLSLALGNMFQGTSLDAAQNTALVTEKLIKNAETFTNVEELRCQGVELNALLPIVQSLSSTLRKLFIIGFQCREEMAGAHNLDCIKELANVEYHYKSQ